MDAAVQFSVHERSKILESYFSTKWVVLIQREFPREFPGRKTPCRKTMTKIAEKFWNTGSVGNGNKGHGGRYVTVRTRANFQTVRKYLEQSPWKSTWRLSQEVGISRTTVQRIIHNDLKLFLYKVQIVQKQTDTNKDKGVNFVKPSVKESRTTQVILAWFYLVMKPIHLSGHVNKQNMRFRASQEPDKHTQQPLSKEKVTVWRAIGKWRIFGSYFSEDNDSNRVTVNAERYILMMRRKFVHAMRRKRDIDMNTVVFQQNVAPPHCSNRTLEYLRQYFPGDRLISRWTDNLWPPISQISTLLTIFCEATWKTEFLKTIHRQQRFSKTTSEKKSYELHKKCSKELWAILMFELLMSYSGAVPGSNISLITRKV